MLPAPLVPTLAIATILLVVASVVLITLMVAARAVPIGAWGFFFIVTTLGIVSCVLLALEFFFSSPYATWEALIGIFGLVFAVAQGTTIPLFLHLNGRIDQLNGRIDQLHQRPEK